MYRSLHAGRAVAASLVVLFHLGGTFAQDKYFGLKVLDIAFAGGDACVEYFFALSGFLIVIAHPADFSRPTRLMRHVGKRIVRIFPTHWVSPLVTVAAFARLFLACLAVAVGFHRTIERPLLNASRPRVAPRRTRAGAPATASHSWQFP